MADFTSHVLIGGSMSRMFRHQVLILEADDPTPDGHLIPDGPTLLPEIDAIMERLARDAQQ